MNRIKSLYEAPTTDILVVRFEESLLTVSGNMEAKSWAAGQTNWFDDDDE